MNIVVHSASFVSEHDVFGKLREGNGAFTWGRSFYWYAGGYDRRGVHSSNDGIHYCHYAGCGAYDSGWAR